MKLKDNLLYVEEHLTCENYNHDTAGSIVDIVGLGEGEKYERSLEIPEILFIYRGEIQISFRDIHSEILDRKKMALLPSGVRVHITAAEDTQLFLCRLHREVISCRSYNFNRLVKHNVSGDRYFNPLNINSGIRCFLDGFVPHVEKKLRCSGYLNLKIMELMYLLRAYYTKESLAAFFYPLLGGDMAFRNFVFTSAGNVSSVEQWAQLANMSSSAFRRKFAHIIGKSPSSFLIEERCLLIRQELEYSTRPMKIIAEKLGFSSMAVFHIYCKKHLKASPGSIRKATSQAK